MSNATIRRIVATSATIFFSLVLNQGALAQTPDAVPGQLAVKFQPEVPLSRIGVLLRDCGAESILDSTSFLDFAREVADLPEELDQLARNVFLLQPAETASPAQDTGVDTLITCFSELEEVEVAEPNFLGTYEAHQTMPNEWVAPVSERRQWGLLNAGQVINGNLGSIDADVDTPQAWDLLTDCTTVVAVLGSGVDLDHPDLAGNLWTNSGEVAGDGIDNEGNGIIDDVNGVDFENLPVPLVGPPFALNPPADVIGHETAVAGIIGAIGNNGMDIAGVCWQFRGGGGIMPLGTGRFAPNQFAFFFSVLYAAVQKAAGQDVRVLNFSGAFRQAAQPAFVALGILISQAADILAVIAGGNDGRNVDAAGNALWPCNDPAPNIICVAASSNRDVLAGFSNFGPTSVDLAAPGADIVSLALAAGPIAGVRFPINGTSFAAPHVTGLAALAFTLFPAKKPAQVKTDLLTGAAGPPAASGVDIVKRTAPNTIFANVVSNGRARWPYTGDLGDAPRTYQTVASPLGGALHWDIGNEFLGRDVSPEVDATTPFPFDQDFFGNIVPIVNFDLDDHPLGPGNGRFAFNPAPPWAVGQVVNVMYQVCSDHLRILDVDGGRYQGGDPDRTVYVNAWFDLNRNGVFAPAELLLQDIISPAPAPVAPPKPANVNVTVNLQPVLAAPAVAPVFPPVTNCLDLRSMFRVPAPGGVPAWVRFRLDYGEDILANNPDPLFRADRTFPMFQHLQWARHGEVEDFPLVEVDSFAISEAQITVNDMTLTLSGPTTIQVVVGPSGEAQDRDNDGLDDVEAEMTQLDLAGMTPLGPAKIRIRNPEKDPFARSIGEIEETQNNTPGILDIQPFTRGGAADSFFDVFVEVEIGSMILHTREPKRMRATIEQKPPTIERYENPDRIELFTEDNRPSGFFLGGAIHFPNPERISVLVRPEGIVSAATFQTPLAPGSISSMFGSRISTETEVATMVPLPLVLAGSTVRIVDSAAQEFLAPLFFVSPLQVNFFIPAEVTPGAGRVIVTRADGSNSTARLEIAPVAPGLFAANQDGQGVAAGIAITVEPDGTQTSALIFDPELPVGERVPIPINLAAEATQVFLTLFGTGVVGTGEPSVTALIADVNVPVQFAGPQGTFVGLDQVNLGPLPPILGGLGEVQILLIVNDQPSNVVTASFQ